jgi:5-methylcytosine-specific restriction endonuclease McrA
VTKRTSGLLRHCPKCGAVPGWPCAGKNGNTRRAVHMERFTGRAGKVTAPMVVKRPRNEHRHPFYNGDAWRAVRYRALKLHGGCCQCCGARARKGHPLHVDHIKPRSKFPELELDLDNLQVLCEDCNLGKRNTDQTDWRDGAAKAQ